jgi:hypothetical protein
MVEASRDVEKVPLTLFGDSVALPGLPGCSNMANPHMHQAAVTSASTPPNPSLFNPHAPPLNSQDVVSPELVKAGHIGGLVFDFAAATWSGCDVVEADGLVYHSGGAVERLEEEHGPAVARSFCSGSRRHFDSITSRSGRCFDRSHCQSFASTFGKRPAAQSRASSSRLATSFQ